MQKKKEITTTKSAEGRSIKKSKSKSDVSSCPFMNSQRVQEVSLFYRSDRIEKISFFYYGLYCIVFNLDSRFILSGNWGY